jgi:hypothetical protein
MRGLLSLVMVRLHCRVAVKWIPRFWKHSQGAGIETQAAHHKTLNVHARGSQRSRQ